MLNPFGSQHVPGSYVNLRKRLFQHAQNLKVNDQIFEVMKKTYDQAMIQENIVLSHPEMNRLLSQLMKMVLEDMLQKLNKDSDSAERDRTE